MKTSNISGTSQPIFSILSQVVLRNNELLNTNYWDDLDTINHGHNRLTFHNFA